MFLTLAVVLQVTQPQRYAAIVRILAFSYLAYSAGVAALTWTRRLTAPGIPVVTHVIDLALFSIFMSLTDGARSPLRSFGSTASRNNGASAGSVVKAQIVMESVASKLSSCRMTTDRGLPA